MLTKFESKSNRVKGLSFHPTRPWILASLHNGVLQLWDYRIRTLLERYEEHDGPVRGIDFHHSQPLFVSGGDDYKIKVWNYKLRRCLFTLLGHLDYIRTVQFHHEYPWIVSASDDQTIRIWNWQSRQSISVLTGHNHYVMSANFHPKDDLVVSASLDNTVRVWDTSGLRKKTVRGAPTEHEVTGNNNAVISRVNADLFGGTDAVVKYLLEGHDRGVNWASFHHSLPLIISGADDRQVKLWRMNETKAWEVDTMRGHTNNVSCVIFHPRRDLIVSNSEDRSIRVWDISRRVGVQTFRRENDRFWILAAHSEQNLLAAGHDSGMLVFKLERERPAYDMQTNASELYYIKDERYLRRYEYSSADDAVQLSLRRSSASGSTTGLGNAPRSLIYNTMNPAEVNILVCSDAEGGTYELVTLPKDGVASGSANSMGESHDSKRGQGLSACFVARNRFAVLDRSKNILIKNFKNEVTKRYTAPHSTTDRIFPAGGAGRVLLRAEDRITLFDVQSRKVISELLVPQVKYVVWNHDSSAVALLCKHGVILCTKTLEQSCIVSETVRVKSGAWDTNGVFVYATLNHVKYCIQNGDHGIIRTLDMPVYITRVFGEQLYCFDRECKVRILSIDTTECKFKMALMRRQYGEVMRMIRQSRLCGQAIIAYLQQKGYPEVALHFVQDKKTRFNLALECGNLDVAMEAAVDVDEDECWNRLGTEALRQGNATVVEMAYQRTRNFERLSFLYLITGNKDKLQKMLKIAEMRKDTMSQFHNSLYLGDVPERIKILESVGQLSLAYSLAATHGFEEDAARLKAAIEEAEVPVPSTSASAKLLLPAIPIYRSKDENWPLLEVSRGLVHEALQKGLDIPDEELDQGNEEVKDEEDIDDMWDDDEDFANQDDDVKVAADGTEKAWGDEDDDLDFGGLDEKKDEDEEVTMDDVAGDDVGGVFVAPQPGVDPSILWSQNSSLAADHAAAGSFETAMRLLNRQIGIVDFDPLKKNMRDIYLGSRCVIPGMPSVSPIACMLHRNDQDGPPKDSSLPIAVIKLQALVDRLRVAYAAFQKGQFAVAVDEFRSILFAIPLVVVKRAEVAEVKELLGICREYILALLLEVKRKEIEGDEVRQAELAVYLTHCKIQSAHLLLVLNGAMKATFKLKNFITAAAMAQRLLGLPEINLETNKARKVTATKVLRKSELNARNEHKLDYDTKTPFHICSVSMKPIYQGEKFVKCSYCESYAKPEFTSKRCPVCTIADIGVETLGLLCSDRQ